jgi:hypothetical protein
VIETGLFTFMECLGERLSGGTFQASSACESQRLMYCNLQELAMITERSLLPEISQNYTKHHSELGLPPPSTDCQMDPLSVVHHSPCPIRPKHTAPVSKDRRFGTAIKRSCLSQLPSLQCESLASYPLPLPPTQNSFSIFSSHHPSIFKLLKTHS